MPNSLPVVFYDCFLSNLSQCKLDKCVYPEGSYFFLQTAVCTLCISFHGDRGMITLLLQEIFRPRTTGGREPGRTSGRVVISLTF